MENQKYESNGIVKFLKNTYNVLYTAGMLTLGTAAFAAAPSYAATLNPAPAVATVTAAPSNRLDMGLDTDGKQTSTKIGINHTAKNYDASASEFNNWDSGMFGANVSGCVYPNKTISLGANGGVSENDNTSTLNGGLNINYYPIKGLSLNFLENYASTDLSGKSNGTEMEGDNGANTLCVGVNYVIGKGQANVAYQNMNCDATTTTTSPGMGPINTIEYTMNNKSNTHMLNLAYTHNINKGVVQNVGASSMLSKTNTKSNYDTEFTDVFGNNIAMQNFDIDTSRSSQTYNLYVNLAKNNISSMISTSYAPADHGFGVGVNVFNSGMLRTEQKATLEKQNLENVVTNTADKDAQLAKDLQAQKLQEEAERIQRITTGVGLNLYNGDRNNVRAVRATANFGSEKMNSALSVGNTKTINKENDSEQTANDISFTVGPKDKLFTIRYTNTRRDGETSHMISLGAQINF